MTDSQMDGPVTLEEGIRIVDTDYVQGVVKYLKTKKLDQSHRNYIKCYSMVLRLCDELDKAKELNDYFKDTLIQHIQNTVLPDLRKKKEEILIKDFVKEWKDYTILVHFMRKMFNYLDRYYLKNCSMQSLATSALGYFKEKCFNQISESLRVALLNQISKDRDGEYVDWDLLKSCIQTFVQMGFITADIVKQDDDYVWKGEKNLNIYESQFEQHLIQRSKEEYSQKSLGWMLNLNCPEYLREAEKNLLKEEERANYFLQQETKPKLLTTIQTEIIEKQAQNLVDKDTGCDSMFQHKKLDELALMFRLFKRVESTLKFIIQKMAPYIEGRGEKIVTDDALLKDPIEFTKQLLALKAEMDEMVEKSFQNDIRFQKNRDVSFQNFMNKCQFTPHYIAAYCDNEFKKGLKGASEADTNSKLDAIIRLFCCLHGRDVFIKAYTKHLSSRLLNKTSLSKDAEELMLQKLKVECGHNTVNKLSQMFTDMNLSKTLMDEYKKTPSAASIVQSGIEFQAEVLTNGHWPEQPTAACTLPPEMKDLSYKFEMFYKQKYQNRNLTWLFHHGSLEIKTMYLLPKNYALVTNCYQAVILLLFNKHTQLTYTQVKEYTSIPEAELNNALLYLCNPKQKILDKENMKRPQFVEDEKISIVSTFANPNVKVNFIPTQTHKKKVAEKNDNEKIDDKEIRLERQNIIDAVIVRIMKARKSDKHNQLLEDVMRQITIFMPQPQMIKQRIESLIEREYLKRDDADRGKYIYLP